MSEELARLLQAEAVRPLIGGASLALDDGDVQTFLGYCDDPFHYRIRVRSPQSEAHTTLTEYDRARLPGVFENLTGYVQEVGRLHRQVTIAKVEPSNVDGFLVVTSSFIVHHTNLEGQTQTFAVGRYIDVVNMIDEKILLAARDVVLDTRDLGSAQNALI